MVHMKTSCPHGLFYAYVNRELLDEVTFGKNPNADSGCESYSPFCDGRFARRMLAHPCRTEDVTRALSVAVLNPVFRAMRPSCTRGKQARAYNTSIRLLSRLPTEITRHTSVSLFAAGEMIMYQPFEQLQPRHTLWFSHEPLFTRQEVDVLPTDVDERVASASGAFRHRSIPGCHAPIPASNVVAVPFAGHAPVQPLHSRDAVRTHRVSFYGGIHGMMYAKELRRRLYAQCAGHSSWLCWNEDRGERFLLGTVGASDFCLCPPGDYPARATIWHALRVGCIPVLFSTCPVSIVSGYNAAFLPREKEGRIFGARTWSVLLNTSATMREEGYVERSLSAISQSKLRAMRALALAHTANLSYYPHAQRGTRDAVDAIVDLMLARARSGGAAHKEISTARAAFSDPNTQEGAPIDVCDDFDRRR